MCLPSRRARRDGKHMGRPSLAMKAAESPEAADKFRRLVAAAAAVRQPPDYLSVSHAARRHRVSERTLRRYLATAKVLA